VASTIHQSLSEGHCFCVVVHWVERRAARAVRQGGGAADAGAPVGSHGGRGREVLLDTIMTLLKARLVAALAATI